MHRRISASLIALFVCLGVAVAVAQQTPGDRTDPQPDPPPGARDRGMGEPVGQDPAGEQGQLAGQRRTGGAGAMDKPMDQQFEQDFLKHAASANQLEIQLGELVGQKAQDQQIKQFAQRIAEDHRQANDQLKQVAQQMNVQISDQLMPVHQAKLQHYQQKQGRQLELGFIFDQVGHHTKDVLEYQYVAQNAQNPQLKQFASQAVPKLRQHLQQAIRIAPGGDEARLAGERIGPADQDPGPGTGMPGRSDDGDRNR